MSEHLGRSRKAISGFLKGFAISAILATIARFGIPASLNVLRTGIHLDLEWIPLLPIPLLGICLTDFRGERRPEVEKPPADWGPARLILFSVGVFLFLWVVPVLILYWSFHPDCPKKAIQIAVFIVSVSFSLVYYSRHPERFPSVADKVTFFTGVALGPPGVIAILM